MKFQILLILLFEITFVKAQSNVRIDSVATAQMQKWLKPRGRVARYNFQLYFKYGEHYLFEGAVGQVSKKDKTVPFRYKYKSASVAKTFIATIVLQLFEEQKFKLDDPIIKYLDSSLIDELVIVNGIDLSRSITIRQLLNHQAGLADYIFDDWRFMLRTKLFSHRNHSPEEHLQNIKKHKLNKKKSYTPGTAYHYSDTGYLLLALLIEKVTANTVAKELATRITQPLGLKDTYVDTWDLEYSQIMHQYYYRKDITKKLHPSVEFGGGGFICSNEDLAKFIQALFAVKLYKSKETLQLMITTNSEGYGLGIDSFKIPENWFKMNSKDSLTVYGHSGFFGVAMFHIPEKNITWTHSIGQSGRYHVDALPPWIAVLRECYAIYLTSN